MKFEELAKTLTEDVELFTKKGEYIGFRTPSGSFGIAADEGYLDPDPDDVMAAEVVDRYTDEEGNDTIIVDLG